MADNHNFRVKNGLEVGGSLQLGGDANPTLTGDGNYLKITTSHGYGDIGAGNTSYFHLQTDLPIFYFNKGLVVDSGIVRSYDEDLALNRAGSSTARLRITAGTTISDQSFNVTGDLTATGYLQATSYLYTRNNLRVLNAAGDGWHTWGTRNNGNYNLSVGTISSGNITTTGYLRGPSTFTIDPATHGDDTGTLVIAGNLQVDGTTTTVNSTTVAVSDLNFTVAKDAANAAAANNAGLTVAGADAQLKYIATGDKWTMNKPLDVTGNLLLDVDNAEINLKSGAGTTSGAINWTFNTAGTDYASIKLPYATRNTKGLWMDSGYPITIDATTRIDFDISGATKMDLDGTGLDVFGTVVATDEFRASVVAYSADQDAPYMIAGTSGYTGATTNWNTFGFQHRIKSNSGGTPRITIDTATGEAFSIDNNKNAIFAGTLNSGAITSSGVVSASGGNSGNWNTAYGWGNHASAGYVTSSGNTIIGTDTDLSFSGANVLSTIALTDGVITAYTNRVLTPANIGAPELSISYRATSSVDGAVSSAGWVTVATNTGGRKHGEIIVSDSDSGDHAFIRIDWMRSYADSNFSVLQVGGHANRITGVRVLSQDSDNTYGNKRLQVYVTTGSTYGVRVNTVGNPRGFGAHSTVTPVIENTKVGYTVHGNELTGLDAVSLAAEEGIKAGGIVYASGGSSTNWNTAYGWGDHSTAGYTSNVGDITGVTAGTGMTGGGTTGTPTLNVIGGSGITANADNITVDSTVIRTTGNQSMSGVKTFTDNGGIKYSGISSTPLWLNRSTGTNVNIRLSSSSGTTYVGQGASSGILEIGTTADLIGTGQRVFADNYHPNADKWTTARTLALTGDVTGSVSWDGSANASMTTTIADDSHNHVLANIDRVALSNSHNLNDYNTQSIISWGSTNPTNSPATYSAGFVLQDSSQPQQLVQTYGGTANKVKLYGRRKTNGNWDSTWTQYFSDHYHPNADKWTTARTLTLSGDVTGSVSFDGSAAINMTNTVVANNSHTHNNLTNYVLKAGDTMTGKLVLPDVGYSLGNEYHKWKRVYVVTTSTPQEILYSDGNSLPTGGVYRFTAHIDGTGTDQFATAVYWNQNGTWRINVTGQSGTSSNHPEFIIDATTNKPTIHIDHTSSYSIQILAERIELTEGTGTDNAGYAFGTDAFLGSVNNNLYFLPGGTAATGPNSYDDGNVVWHTGNLTTTNKSNYDTAYGWGNHASAGYTSNVGDITGVTAGTGLTGGGTSGTPTLNVIGGSGITANANDIAVDSTVLRTTGAQTKTGNLTLDSGTSTLLNVRCDNGGNAIVRAGGQGQGTGVFEVSQDDGSHGGGMSYNGDATPTFVSGETADHVTFYRINAGTRSEVFHYPYSSDTVNFNGSITLGGTVDGRDVAADGTKLDGIATGATANVGDITAVTAGTGLTGGGTSGGVTLNVIGGTGITANADNITVDSTVLTTSTYGTTLNPVYAPVKKGTATLTNSYQTVCTVNGNSLASAVRMTIAGTGPSTVIGTILDIVCNHSLDILVTSQTGTYTILTVKIVSNNNEDFAVQLKTNSTNNLPVNMEVFALNSETVTFTSTNPYTGATLEHECKNGGFASSSSGGAAHEFYSNGTKVIAANDNQALHDTDALSISGNVITLKKGDNTTETVTIPAQGDITGVTAGTGLSGGGTSGTVSLAVDLSELTDMTAAVVGTQDELILLDNGADRRKLISEITLSDFNNDSGWTSNAGDITAVTAGTGLTGGGTSGAVTLNVIGGSGITANANDIAVDSTVLRTTGAQEMNGALTIDVDNVAAGALRIEANQTNPEQDFYFAEEIYSTLSGSTVTTADREQGAIYIDLNSSATGGGTSHEHRVYGIYADVDSTGDADVVTAGYFNATATPTTGTTTQVCGVEAFAEDNGGAGSTTNIIGTKSTAWSDNATSDVNVLSGGQFKAGNAADSGAIAAARGVQGEIELTTSSGDIYGNSYVFEAQYDNNTGAAPTHTAALYYGNYAGVLPTTAYGVQIVDTVRNAFAGTLETGLGTTSLVSYGFIGDLNTGMYSPANHQLGFTANGSQILKLTTTGATVTGDVTVTTGNYTTTANRNRFTTPSGYIEFGPMNTSWAHIYTDRSNFYFNKNLYVNGDKVFHATYHPNADTLTTARNIGGVSFNGSANINLPGVNTAGNQNTSGSSGSCTGNAATATALTSGNKTITGDLTVSGNQVVLAATAARVKFSVWSGTTYGIGMESGYTFGAINNDYVMSFQMNQDSDRGFWWGDTSHTNAQGAMALSTDGYLTVARGMRIGFGESDTTHPLAGIQCDGTLDIRNAAGTGSSAIHVPRGGYISIYGDGSANHAITSRGAVGSATDDIRINSYGSLFINLDSNSNNSSNADFVIGKHGSHSSTMAQLVTISGEDGDITTSGNVTAYSDERLKSDIQTLDGKKVLQMRGVSFTKEGKAGSGVIAQELEKIAPELVRDGEYKSVSYGNLVGYLIENAKTQQKEIDELKSLVKQLIAN